MITFRMCTHYTAMCRRSWSRRMREQNAPPQVMIPQPNSTQLNSTQPVTNDK